MSSIRVSWLLVLLLKQIACLHACAQTSQFLPEIDVYHKPKPELRTWFQAKDTREGGDSTTAEIGPSIDLYMNPWINLKKVTAFDLDDSKGRPLVLSAGYRYLPYPDAPTKNRMETILITNLPMKDRFLLHDRNRADLDWQGDKFFWEYRNRLQVERPVKIRLYHFSAYVSAESFYQAKYKKWSDTALYAGCVFPSGNHLAINPYYEHQNNTGKGPNQQLNQAGLVLSLHL